MTTSVRKTATLADLSKELGINKSKLNYYAGKGLLVPVQTVGKTMVFNKTVAKKQLRIIEREQAKGKKLKEIKIVLSKIKK